jgi:hypothetical protein
VMDSSQHHSSCLYRSTFADHMYMNYSFSFVHVVPVSSFSVPAECIRSFQICPLRFIKYERVSFSVMDISMYDRLFEGKDVLLSFL